MNNFKNYNLLDNNTTSSTLNYNYNDYNNYKSWSNTGRTNIKVSSIDEHNNIITTSFKTNRIPKMYNPYLTPTEPTLSWSNKVNKNSKNNTNNKNNKKNSN